MKQLFAILLFAFCSLTISAQGQLQYKDVNHFTSDKVRYKLYPTFNMWTFLKLDTQTGRVSALQFSVESTKNEGELYIGMPYEKVDLVNGRYELYPTSNIWTFLMVDQIDGKVYHVQWSQDNIYNNYVKLIE